MTDAFNDRADVYESMIDWHKRLAHETPFYRAICETTGAHRVLDAACGTGHHARLFRQWGLAVEAADLSPAMLDRARAATGDDDAIRFVQRGYDQPIDSAPFDLAICVGNSLALAPDESIARAAVANLVGALRPGGVAVFHVLNLWRLPDGPPVWQKCVLADIQGEKNLVIKGVHRCGGRGFVDLLVTKLTGPTLKSDCPSFLGLEADDLRQWATHAGAESVEVFGGYRHEPYDRAASTDLIVVARR